MKKMPLLATVMSPFPYSIDLDASFEEASELMGHHDVRHLPVTHDHTVVGVITDKDMTSANSLRPGESGSGELTVRARVGQRTRPGALWMPFHFVDEPTNRITNDAFDNITRTAEYKVCAARVTKAAAPSKYGAAEPS